MRKVKLLLLICLFATTAAFAQTGGKISGSIKDDQAKAHASATASLLRAKDSGLVKVSLSDKAGVYEFINIKPGKYFVSITSVGFAKAGTEAFELEPDGTIEVPVVALQPAAKGLSEVTVQAKRPFIETKIDKTVVNVEASPTNAGSTALEVLEKSPGVMVNNDGIISLRGKQGVIVMMDGKRTFLSATDLATMLRNMPASALDQIEIMTNPSSKYDAEGNAGVINIKTKKGKADGWNGSVTLGAGSSIYSRNGTLYMNPRSQNSFNFNYRRNKVNLFGNYNPNLFRGMNTLAIDRNFYDQQSGAFTGSSAQETFFKFGNENQMLKVGLDYYANKKNVFGVVASGFMFNGRPRPRTVSSFYDAAGNFTSRMISHTKNDISFRNFTGNMNWKHTFDSTGKELSADFDYVTYANVADMTLTTDNFSATVPVGSMILRGHLPSFIDIYSVKTDYTHPFKGGRFEAGLKSSWVTTDNLVDYERMFNDKWVTDDRSNHFVYEENINAAYVNVNRQFKKITVQGGLRIEQTKAVGDQITTRQGFKRDTTNLFPTAFLSYALNKKNNFTLSYAKRITRPSYQNLNPFTFFLDSLTFQRGNPNLRPHYTHNIELSHSFLSKFITTLAFNNTRNMISQMIQQEDVPGKEYKKTFNTVDNVAKLNSISLSITAPFKFTKWWNANFFTTLFNNHFEGFYNGTPIDISATSFMANMTNTFTLSKTVTGEISGFYRHKNLDQLNIMNPFYQMSLGLRKQVIKGKGTLSLNVRDPFAWSKFSGYTRYEKIDIRIAGRPDIRQVNASFTYRFGKNTPQNQPRRRTSGSQDEQNRVGGAGQQ